METSLGEVKLQLQLLMTNHYLRLSKQVRQAGYVLSQDSKQVHVHKALHVTETFTEGSRKEVK